MQEASQLPNRHKKMNVRQGFLTVRIMRKQPASDIYLFLCLSRQISTTLIWFALLRENENQQHPHFHSGSYSPSDF